MNLKYERFKKMVDDEIKKIENDRFRKIIGQTIK